MKIFLKDYKMNISFESIVYHLELDLLIAVGSKIGCEIIISDFRFNVSETLSVSVNLLIFSDNFLDHIYSVINKDEKNILRQAFKSLEKETLSV